MRGKRTDMPSAVCASFFVNSAPVISQTGDFYGNDTDYSHIFPCSFTNSSLET